MHLRRLLLVAGLIGLLAPASAAAAGNVPTLGPASFVKATGGMFTVPIHPGGLSVYSSSPAYVILRAEPSFALTATLKADAATHNFTWVAIPNTRGGRPGMDCFSNGHLVTTKSRVDSFTENQVPYNGFFLQYLSWHFKAGARKPADCAPARGGITAAPSISVGGTSANLHVDCLVKTCNGTFVSYGATRLCKRTKPVFPGHRGCPLIVNGHFKMSGGLSVNFKLPLRGRSPSAILVALTVNGKRGPATPLSRLPRAFALPPKQHAASIALTCPASGTLGTPVTVSGTLSPSGAPVPVALTFLGAGGSAQSTTATTSASGTFTAQFTPSAGLVWVVDALFAGDRTRTHAEKGCGFSVTQ